MNAIEKLNLLFDEGTFSEFMRYYSRTSKENEPESVVCGYGGVNGSLVFAFAQDFTRSKGMFTAAQADKIIKLFSAACNEGAPVIGVFSSAGAELDGGVSTLAGYGRLMSKIASSYDIPKIAVISGTCGASSAVCASLFNFTIQQADSSYFVSPPFLTGENAGSAQFNLSSGLVADTGADFAECAAKARTLVSMLPPCRTFPLVENYSADTPDRSIDISFYDSSPDAHALIDAVCDSGTFYELYGAFAPEAVVGFASFGGVVCGICANNKSVNGGTITAESAKKLAAHINLCRNFSIPVVTFADTKGADISEKAEMSPLAREYAVLAQAYADADMPLVTVITGEAYGAAYTLMGSKALGANVAYALENAKIGVMDASSAVAFLENDKIHGDVTRQALEDEWNRKSASPMAAAVAGEIDDIIEPSELRKRVCSAILMLTAGRSAQ